jgi:hypothetical protein
MYTNAVGEGGCPSPRRFPEKRQQAANLAHRVLCDLAQLDDRGPFPWQLSTHCRPSRDPNPPAVGPGSQAARNPSKPVCRGTSPRSP